MKRCVRISFLMVLALGLSMAQSMALDYPVLAKIEPVLAYDPATQQSKPFYPIGWYYCGPFGSFELMKAMSDNGANMVLLTDVGASPEWHYGVVRQDLDWAQQLGMKVVVAIWTPHLNVNRDEPATYKHLEWIHDVKNHPALLGWQLGDEVMGSPDPATQRAVLDVASLFRQWDPHHLIWQVSATGVPDESMANYMKGTDVFSLDFYQYFDKTGPFGGAKALLTAYTHCGELAGARGWRGNLNVTQAVGADKGPLAEYRFPSLPEYRWNVFSHMAAAGSRGTINWIYDGGSHYYSNPEMFTQFRDKTARPVMMELRQLQHALETGWNVGAMDLSWTTKGDDAVPGAWKNVFPRVSGLMLYDDSARKYFAVITNNADLPQDITATLSALPVPLQNLSVVASTGGVQTSKATLIDVGNGSFRLDTRLDGYGVGIYELTAAAP